MDMKDVNLTGRRKENYVDKYTELKYLPVTYRTYSLQGEEMNLIVLSEIIMQRHHVRQKRRRQSM